MHSSIFVNREAPTPALALGFFCSGNCPAALCEPGPFMIRGFVTSALPLRLCHLEAFITLEPRGSCAQGDPHPKKLPLPRVPSMRLVSPMRLVSLCVWFLYRSSTEQLFIERLLIGRLLIGLLFLDLLC